MVVVLDRQWVELFLMLAWQRQQRGLPRISLLAMIMWTETTLCAKQCKGQGRCCR